MRILKIESLPPAKVWIDRDNIMLHSCFQILKDAIEKEKVDKHVNYESHKDFVDEVKFLHKWWKKRLKMKDPFTFKQMDKDDEMLIRLIKIRTQLWT